MCSRQLSQRVHKTINSLSALSTWNYMSTVTSLPQKENPRSTVDPSDVELFSKLMKEWWHPNSEIRLLQSMNLVRVPFIRDGLVSSATRELLPLRNKKILDVGCGGGILSEALARLGAEITGIDASTDLITVAEAHKERDPRIAEYKPNYICTTIEDHCKENSNFYDAVVASEVIEHVHNQELFVKSCVQALKPGGRIFFTSPNKTRLSQLAIIFFSENVLRLVPKGSHQYEKFLHANELTFILERNDCLVERSYGICYNPITKNWSLSEHQQLFYAIQALKLNP